MVPLLIMRDASYNCEAVAEVLMHEKAINGRREVVPPLRTAAMLGPLS